MTVFHPQHPRFFIAAAEPSADLHAASLIRSVRKSNPNADFVGLAGPKMQDQGCRAIADLTSAAAMLTGALGNVGRASAGIRATDREFATARYDVAVLLDSPMLNFPLALRARLHGIPVLYYIAPQLWAWGAYRLHKLKARVNKLAVVLPFEEPYFRNLGLDATFVGHPLFDALIDRPVNRDRANQIKADHQPVIAILPGSRKHVIREVLPGQLHVAAAIIQKFPNAHVGLSVASPDVTDLIRTTAKNAGVNTTLYHNENPELIAAADLTLVASGTATLEVAYYGSPMIVMYNGSRLMYQLVGRWMISLNHLSLVNILADRELVPEFMPYYDATAPIARVAIDLLSNQDQLDRMRRDIAETIAPLNKPGASDRAARVLMAMV